MEQRWREQARGFTLTEASVVVAILALTAAVAIPALSNLTRADLRATAGKLSANMRATYDSAALTGQTHRMAFVFASEKSAPAVRIEASPEVLQLDPEKGVLTRALGTASGGGGMSWESFAGQLDAEEAKDADPEELEKLASGALESVLGAAAREDRDEDEAEDPAAQGFTEAAPTLEIPEGLKILDVWTEGMDKPVSDGEVYVYFFPNGYTQHAIVHLEDDNGGVMSVTLAPLTGRPTIVDEYVEVPK